MNDFGIPNRVLYCVRCREDTEHIARTWEGVYGVKGNSWHYYCSECSLRYFHAPPRTRRNKRMQFQIGSWIESEEYRIKEDKLLKALNL